MVECRFFDYLLFDFKIWLGFVLNYFKFYFLLKCFYIFGIDFIFEFNNLYRKVVCIDYDCVGVDKFSSYYVVIFF